MNEESEMNYYTHSEKCPVTGLWTDHAGPFEVINLSDNDAVRVRQGRAAKAALYPDRSLWDPTPCRTLTGDAASALKSACRAVLAQLSPALLPGQAVAVPFSWGGWIVACRTEFAPADGELGTEGNSVGVIAVDEDGNSLECDGLWERDDSD